MTKLLIVLALLLAALPVSAQSGGTPTPMPLPQQEMYEALATQSASLGTLPPDLTQPDGSPMLPQNNSRLFIGYAKWLLSPSAADEWAGPFAPIFQHIGIGVYMYFALMGVYGVVYVIANFGGWVAWLWALFDRIWDRLLQLAQAAPFLLVLVVILAVAFIIFGQESVQQWIAENLQKAWDWAQNALGDLLGRR